MSSRDTRVEITQTVRKQPLLWQFHERTSSVETLVGKYDESQDLWTVTVDGVAVPLVATDLALATTVTATKTKQDPGDND